MALVLEALDGRRALAQLDAVMDPTALRYLRAAARTPRAGGVSQLRSLHVGQPAVGVAEVAALVHTGGRARALVARFERDHADPEATIWRCTLSSLPCGCVPI